MSEVVEKLIHCPYCGEQISIMVDASVPEQQYTEDCQVCCRPMVLDVTVDVEGETLVRAQSENE